MQRQAKEGDVKDGSQSKGRVRNGQRAGVRALRLRISSLQGRAVRRAVGEQILVGPPAHLLPSCRFHIHIISYSPTLSQRYVLSNAEEERAYGPRNCSWTFLRVRV